MKYLSIVALFSFILVFSCKTEPKASTTKTEPEAEKSIPEKIADAHGYENWKSVSEITFTFNVDRDSTHFERSWVWKPKMDEVTSISGVDTLTYNRKSMDSIAHKTNGGFINDRYWLMAPFNLMWDANNYTFEHSEQVNAPISGDTMQKLTIVYSDDGGYTPGDAYDFYFKDDFILREWAYRKSNQPEPNLVSTWEDYANVGGLEIAQVHKRPDSNFQLYFTGLSVSKE